VPKTVKLMLTESVESLGIVGDVVNVRIGYARNFLLPRNFATQPSDEAIRAIQAKRAEAQKHVAEHRKHREEVIAKLQNKEFEMVRSCNDLGHLYASVTQQEIATLLTTAGYPVKPRDVRLHVSIKRVETYDIHVKFDSDLDAHVKLHVKPDRKIEQDKREEVEVDDHGNMIHKPKAKDGAAVKEGEPAPGGDRPERRRDREDRPGRGGRRNLLDALTPKDDEQKPGTWGKRPGSPTADTSAAPASETKPSEAKPKDKSDKPKDQKKGKDADKSKPESKKK
jgi:large subunit ribosomal protein L9